MCNFTLKMYMLCSMTGLFRPSFLATPWENDRTDAGVGYSFTLVVFIICSTFSSPGLWMNVWPFWKVARGHAVLRRKPALVRDNWKPQVNGKVEGKSFYHDQLYSMTSALVQWIPLRKKPPKKAHTHNALHRNVTVVIRVMVIVMGLTFVIENSFFKEKPYLISTGLKILRVSLWVKYYDEDNIRVHELTNTGALAHTQIHTHTHICLYMCVYILIYG